MSGFFERMKTMPKSEQSFFAVSSIDPIQLFVKFADEALFVKYETITQVIIETAGMNLFGYFLIGGFVHQMMPIFSMMQQFLIACAGKDKAIKITPRIGLSSVADIVNNGRNDTRDMALPFIGVNLPRKAGGLKALRDRDFIGHDLYHAVLSSEVPVKYRPAFIKIAEEIELMKEEFADQSVSLYLDELYHRMIDNEHPHFWKWNESLSSVSNPAEGQLFVEALSYQVANTFERIMARAKAQIGFQIIGIKIIEAELMGYALINKSVIRNLFDRLFRTHFFERYEISKEMIRRVLAYHPRVELGLLVSEGYDRIEILIDGEQKRLGDIAREVRANADSLSAIDQLRLILDID